MSSSRSFALRLAPARVFGGAEFWRLWYVGLSTAAVRWMEALAMAIFVYQRTGSPFLVAVSQMMRLVPMALFGAIIGSAAERIERRIAFAALIVMMAACSGALALLAFGGQLQVWQIFVGCFVSGIGWAADNPVRRAAIGEVVGAERMGTAMSLDVAGSNGSRMLGPMLGGLMLFVGGMGAVLSTSVALYATSLIAMLMLRYRNQHAPTGTRSVLGGVVDGLRVVRGDPRLVGTLVVTVIYNVFAWPFTSMVPVIAEGSLHLNDAHTGLLQGMDGVGALIGAVAIALLLRRRERFVQLYIGGMFAYLLMIIAFALAPSAFPAGAALVAEGLGGSGYSIMQATLVFLFAPLEMRSRMLGVLSVCIGTGPIGFLHLGLLADWLGAPMAVVVSGVEGLVVMALTWPLWRRIVA